MKKYLAGIFLLLFIPAAMSADVDAPDAAAAESDTFITAEEISYKPPNQTECASRVFSDALAATVAEVNESDPEYIIQGWIYKNFQSPENIKKALACPEIAKSDDEDTISFMPIEYTFASGRRIVVNYATQPKVMKQRMIIANKRSLPETNPSPKIGAIDDPTVWTNTDPAWYGILVVQSGTLDEFIGEDKNNVISLKYLKQNIDKFYPKGMFCTSKSALANDNYIINLAAHKSVSMEDDSNDYYVAGNVNLQWITWAEIALDVAITVATVGGGQVILAGFKGARAANATRGLLKSIGALRKLDKVKDYEKVLRGATKTDDAIKAIRAAEKSADIAGDIRKLENEISALKSAGKSTLNAERQLSSLKDGQRLLNSGADIKKYEKELETLNKSRKEMEKLDDVKKYNQELGALKKVQDLRHAMKAWKMPQRGNVIARSWRKSGAIIRSLRAINGGNRTIGKAARLARSGMKSGKLRNWLFHSTLRAGGMLAKFTRNTGIIYSALNFIGDMYDYTETSTGEFTNNVNFEPLCLLSADDLQGQDNVVNHGMWLMWYGDSVNPADDDAAYLQAMDFAEKFHQDLEEIQDEKGAACSVDMFVVRPIIRNPGDDDAALYYLIMNDQPWQSQ
ncbi:MAG: hypothetical protein LBD50_02785 [Rickettsiales bacterium]|jgi:hypothetical protein|nr:hypothetical protein [Rickettsiales bacterium]